MGTRHRSMNESLQASCHGARERPALKETMVRLSGGRSRGGTMVSRKLGRELKNPFSWKSLMRKAIPNEIDLFSARISERVLVFSYLFILKHFIYLIFGCIWSPLLFSNCSDQGATL